MEAKREVAKGEGEKYAKSVNSLFYEVSAKINTGTHRDLYFAIV